MTHKELWPQAGDVWVKPNGDKMEWLKGVKPGGGIFNYQVLINGKMPNLGDTVDVRFFKTDTQEPFYNGIIHLAPGQGVEVYRHDVRIHPKDGKP